MMPGPGPLSQSLDNSQVMTDSQGLLVMSQGTMEELEKNTIGMDPSYDVDLRSILQYPPNSQELLFTAPVAGFHFSALNQATASVVTLQSSQNMPDSQASSGSQTENVQPDVPFPGNYSFNVTVDKKNSKTNFSEKLNQLFVNDEVNVGFEFKYNFKECKDSRLIAFLRHSEVSDAGEPVKRCMKHIMEAQKNRDNGSKSRSDELEVEDHVLVCTDDKAKHFKDRLGRCKVDIPLRSPAPGCDTVTKVFLFKCKNSDDFGHQKKKPLWTIIFELKTKSGETVGRQVLNVKVSACPQRDYHKVDGGGTTDITNTRLKKRKSKSSAASSRSVKRPSAAAGAPSRPLNENGLSDQECNFGSQEEVDPSCPNWIQEARRDFSRLSKAMQSAVTDQEKEFLQDIAMVVRTQTKQFDKFKSSLNTAQTAVPGDVLKTEHDDSSSADFLFENYDGDHI